MRIDRSRLNPLYHQYSNEENRLTHALLHTIASSPVIFSGFLKKALGIEHRITGKKFEVSTQKTPFSQADNDPDQIESIPDAWIVDDTSEIGIAIEVKDRKRSLTKHQLNSHAKRIREYAYPYLLVITPDLQYPELLSGFGRKSNLDIQLIWRSWDEIYVWFRSLQLSKGIDSFLIDSFLEYLEKRREVLGFQGVSFKSGFDVSEAKIILNAEMEELNDTVKKVYRTLVKRRPAITTFSKGSVWDCFGVEDGFTGDMHLTLSIHEEYHDISLTVPNSSRKCWKRLKEVFGDDILIGQLLGILDDMKAVTDHVFMEFIQRHFVARKLGIRDGYMEFNIDTLGHTLRSGESKVKEFPMWFDALKHSIVNKKGINGQVMFKARFYLRYTKGIDRREFIETAKSTVESLKPLYDFLESN